MSNTIVNYDKIIERLEKEIKEREIKCEKNQNEPSRFYYHHKQLSIMCTKLAFWLKEKASADQTKGGDG